MVTAELPSHILIHTSLPRILVGKVDQIRILTGKTRRQVLEELLQTALEVEEAKATETLNQ